MQSHSSNRQSPADDTDRELLGWSATAGFGLGAAADVLLFHLVLQHHHLFSGYIDPRTSEGLRANVAYDGIFLLLMLGVGIGGLLMLWRASGSRLLSRAYLGGGLLVGAGLFNVIDGVASHYLLGLHDVVHESAVWNPHWVVVSLVLLGTGVGLLAVSNGPERSTA